jgi:hypothetical protein
LNPQTRQIPASLYKENYMTVTRIRSFTMIVILAVALPGCVEPVSAPAPEEPPAPVTADQRLEQEPAEDGVRDRKIDPDIGVDVGDDGVRVDVGADGVNVDVGSNGVQVDIGDDTEQDKQIDQR